MEILDLMFQCLESLTVLIEKCRVDAYGKELTNLFVEGHPLQSLIGPFDCGR